MATQHHSTNYTTNPIISIYSHSPSRVNTYACTPLPQKKLAIPILVLVYFSLHQNGFNLTVGFN